MARSKGYNGLYKGWTVVQRQREYARLKNEWYENHPWDEKAYDEFISRITKELRI